MKKMIRPTAAILIAAVLISGCTAHSSSSSSYAVISRSSSGSASVETAASYTLPADLETEYAKDPDKTDSEAFAEYVHDLFIEEVSSDTLSLHYNLKNPSAYGIDETEVSYGSTEICTKEENEDYYYDLLAHLNAFDYNQLTSEQQVTWDCLAFTAQTGLQGAAYDLYYEPFSTNSGMQAELPVLLAEFDINNTDDLTAYIGLLKSTGDYFDGLMDFEKQKSEAGLFMTDSQADEIIASCEDFISDGEDNYLIRVSNEKIEALDFLNTAEKDEAKVQAKQAVTNNVIPAYERLIATLESLKGTGVNSDHGVCGFTDGQAYYEYLTRQNACTSTTFSELYDMVYEQINADYSEVYSILNSNRSLYNQISSFSFSLTDPEEILSSLQTSILSEFPQLPIAVTYELKTVDASLADYMSPAFYLTPCIDAPEENVIYINSLRNSDVSELYATLAHEGFPGHLYQNVYMSAMGVDEIRYLLDYPGYTEGWATYAEVLSYQMDPGLDSDLARVMQLNNSITLGLYAYMDMGVNHEYWTMDDLADFLNEYFGVEDDSDTVTSLWNMLVTEPANYLSYYLGYLQFSGLRTTAENALGERFSAVEFHRFLMELGTAPFDVIKERLADWVNAQ